jgi:hypothetical protein
VAALYRLFASHPASYLGGIHPDFASEGVHQGQTGLKDVCQASLDASVASAAIGHEAALRLEYWVWFYRFMNVDSRTATEGKRPGQVGGITMSWTLVES